MSFGLIGDPQMGQERICVIGASDPIGARLGLQFHWGKGHLRSGALPNLSDYSLE
jgi:hypothetical protein